MQNLNSFLARDLGLNLLSVLFFIGLGFLTYLNIKVTDQDKIPKCIDMSRTAKSSKLPFFTFGYAIGNKKRTVTTFYIMSNLCVLY